MIRASTSPTSLRPGVGSGAGGGGREALHAPRLGRRSAVDQDDPRSPSGGGPAPASLFDLLYAELKEVAARRMRGEAHDHTLQPTALLHEAWLRLDGFRQGAWQGPEHYKAVAARAMRQVLVDHARGRDAERRGGRRATQPLDEERDRSWVVEGADRVEILALEAALTALAERSERQARVVELRFFGGLGQAETAQALGVSEETVKRDWRLARAWLHRELERGGGR